MYFSDLINFYGLTSKNSAVLFTALIAFLIVAYIATIFSNLAATIAPNSILYGYIPISDTFHTFFGFYTFGWYDPFFLILPILYIVIFILTNRKAVQITFHILIYLIVMYLLRSTIISVTQIPNSQSKGFENASFYPIFAFNDDRFGDCMFSGHTIVYMLCGYVYDLYSKNLILTYIGYSLGIFSIFGLIISRGHYTMDILVTIFISANVWIVYDYCWYFYLKDGFLSCLVNEN